MKLILLESYEADLSNSGYNIQFGEELTEIQTNLYSVCKHSDTFLAHCMDQSIHIATSLQHFFCSLYKVMDLFIFLDMNISEISVFTSLEISGLTSCTHLPPHSLHSLRLYTLLKSNLYYIYFFIILSLLLF